MKAATRQHFHLLVLAGLLVLTGCSSTNSGDPEAADPKKQETGTQGTETPGQRSITGSDESSKDKSKRLIYLDNALSRWMEADYGQQYARRDSMASLIRTYTADHFDAIVRDLRVGSPRRRQVMAGALGFSGNPKAVQPLTEALRDDYYEVILHALISFTQLARTRDVQGEKINIVIDPEPIVGFLTHPRAEIRSNAALALSAILNAESKRELLVPLITAAEDRDNATRVHAVAAIGSMKRREGLPHLVNALRDSVQLVRVRAALALGRLGLEEAVLPLIAVLEREDEKADVRKAAARSLAVILEESLTLDASVWRARAAEAGLTKER